MKNKIIVAALLAFVLASCNDITSSFPSSVSSTSNGSSVSSSSNKTSPSNSTISSSSSNNSSSSQQTSLTSNKEDNFYIDPASKEYTNRIGEPSSTVQSFSELANRLDYAAFYHLATIDATLNYSFTSAAEEVNKAYWSSHLLPCVVDPHLQTQSGSSITVSFKYYREGTKHFVNTRYTHMESLLPGVVLDATNKRASDFTAFAYKEFDASADVVSTQQLMYALEFGYKPLPLTGTPAESALKQCEDILRNIVSDSMGDMAKYCAIYSYCGTHLCYDFTGDDYVGKNSVASSPNAIAATTDGFFLDGALQGFAVCEGWTKLFTVLTTMEGLTCYNASGYPTSFDFAKSIFSVKDRSWNTHAYNYATMKNRYYVVDASWSQFGYSSGYPIGWSYFFVSKTNHIDYSYFTDSTALPSTGTISVNDFDVFNAMSFSYNNGNLYQFTIATQEAFNDLLLYFYQGTKSGYYPTSVGWSMAADFGSQSGSAIDGFFTIAKKNLQDKTGENPDINLYQTFARGSFRCAVFYLGV